LVLILLLMEKASKLVRECKTPAFFSASCVSRSKFVKFCGILERLFGVSLPMPALTGSDDSHRLSSFKRFCSAPLERRMHLWDSALLRCSRDVRHSIWMSLFLFRKTLPSSPPDPHEFLDKISSPPPEADSEFMDFVRNEVPKICPVGWDRGYAQACLSDVLSTKSCVELGKKKGGNRGLFMDNRTLYDGREAFVESLLVSEEHHELPPSRLSAVETAGKWRLISVPGFEMQKLKPLHTVLYDHISRKDWCLRGDAKPASFVDFCKKESEVFVSGDYESATDNLNSDVQKEILRLVLESCRHVPNGVRRLAMASLSTKLVLKRGELTRTVDVRNGQMMGYLLSFPLLCLVNYLAFRFAIPRKEVPVRINGDDIVFRSSCEERDRWMEVVGVSGLVLSKGKTLVDRRYFSLNSRMFKANSKTIAVIPIVRSNTFFPEKTKEALLGLRGRFNTFCPGFFGTRRSALRVAWLRENSCLIEASRRSLTRGLGLAVRLEEVMSAGLWTREAWYLSFEAERPLPSSLSEWTRRPEGYEYYRVPKLTKKIRNAQKEVAPRFVDAAWLPRKECDTDSWEKQLFEGTFEWGGWAYQRFSGNLKRVRLLGLSSRNVVRFLSPRRELFNRLACTLVKYGAWRKSTTCGLETPNEISPDGTSGLRYRPLQFLPGGSSG